MKKLLFILSLTIPFIGFGQFWTQQFGGFYKDYGSSVQQTTDRGYIIVGSSYNGLSYTNPNPDVYLIKTDVNGNELWTKKFGEKVGYIYNNYDEGRSVQQTSDGGYIICGQTNSFSNDYDVYLIKTDLNGDSLWTKTFGGTSYDDGYSVQQTSDGGYIITGRGDFQLIKTDMNGNSLWTKTFADGEGKCVEQTTDGGYIIAGNTYRQNGGVDIYLVKTDINGNELWTKRFGGGEDDYGNSVQQTNDGGYIVAGTRAFDYVSLWSNVYLIKTDQNGNELWNKTFGEIGINSYGNCVKQTNDGGYIITGKKRVIRASIEHDDVYLIKTDGNGNEIWSKTIGTVYPDEGFSVQQTNDGGYIIAGTRGYFSDPTDVYLIKTDGSGNITSTFNIPIPSNRKREKVFDMLGREIKPQHNAPFIKKYDDGSTEKKLIIEK